MDFKKLIVVSLIVAVAADLSASAYGQDMHAVSSGIEVEEIQEDAKKEFRKAEIQEIILPTDTENLFDFILDPQRLITITNAAAHDGETFEKNATLFFKRSDGGVEEDYYSSSAPLTISNMGDTEVEVVLTAEIASLGGIRMTDDKKFTHDTRPSLYLALTDGENTVAIDEKKGASIHAVIPADTNGGNTYSFQLTGAANDKGDWGKLGKVNPRITVTWQILPISKEEDEISGDQEEMSDISGDEASFQDKKPVETPEIPEELPQENTPTEPEE